MALTDPLAAARDQLNRTLTFFPRVDGKASVILAVDTSMLAVLATRSWPALHFGWHLLPLGLALLALGVSFWHLYREAFPQLEGGQQSLLYFREIANLTESRYLEAWKASSDEQNLNDLLGQTWRNSQILRSKFDHLKQAYIALACATPPWAVTLVLLSWNT
jgi:Family of unknown function (DUF5706)